MILTILLPLLLLLIPLLLVLIIIRIIRLPIIIIITHSTSSSSAFTTDRDYHVLQQQPHVLYVSTKQHGNPILQYIRNVPFTYTRMVPDYIFSNTSCAIYLSCKYHILYRNYIHTRIAALKTDFTCRILLLYMDMDDTDKILHEINVLCVNTISL